MEESLQYFLERFERELNGKIARLEKRLAAIDETVERHGRWFASAGLDPSTTLHHGRPPQPATKVIGVAAASATGGAGLATLIRVLIDLLT